MMHVTWEVDVDADTPKDAARQALAIQRRADSTATVFDVTDESGHTVHVDLDENEDVELLMCGNCGKQWADYELEYPFPDIPGLLERIEPGGTVPAGECPACGALVYAKAEPVRVFVLLDGRLVQDVLPTATAWRWPCWTRTLKGRTSRRSSRSWVSAIR